MSPDTLLKSIPKPYELVRRSLNAFFTTFHSHTATGVENIPLEGPTIFASNHSSFYDPPVIGVKVSRQIHYLARDTLFKGFFGRCLHQIGTIPVARGKADVQSIKSIFKVLKNQQATAIFPEGTRSLDGQLKEPEAGIGMIALKTKATVVPARIFGAFEAFGRNNKLPRLGIHIHVSYGKPLTYAELNQGEAGENSYLAASKKIMLAIQSLHPPKEIII